MRIAYILNYDQTDVPKKLRAGSESFGNGHVAYPGFPPFSHGSMGMDLLNSGFDVLPVANSDAKLERICFRDCSEGSPINTGSPYYGPPSTSPSQISSLVDLEEAISSIHQDPTTSTSQKSMPKAASPSPSPWFTGGPLNTASPDYGPPSTSPSGMSSLPDFESESSIRGDPTTSTPQESVPEDASSLISSWFTGGPIETTSPHCGRPSSPLSQHSSVSKWESRSPALVYNDPTTSIPQGSPKSPTWPLSPWMTEEYLNEECKPEGPKSFIDPNSIWFGGCNGWAGTEPAPGAYGVKNYGYSIPSPDPTKLVGESQARPVAPASSNTKDPQRICTNRHITRYEDGEVLRYGAGESYRPFNNGNRDRERSPPPRRARSPLRTRSPIRDRDRDLRARTPPIISDSYVPNRSPRRRSRSPDRYRGPDRARDMGGESWRRRDNSRARIRSPVRRMSPRRSPRRSPGRFSPGPRRDDRFDRARSPRRDFDIRDR